MASSETTPSPIPVGFLGNLSDEQEVALKQMWSLFVDVMDKGEDAFDTSKNDGWKADRVASREVVKELGSGQRFAEVFWAPAAYEHPDALMLRFLRARKWDVEKAFAMLANMIKYRVDFDVEGIVEKGDAELNKDPTFALQMNSGKVYLHGTDNNGRPVIYVHVRMHTPSQQPLTTLQTFCIYVNETCHLLFTPPTNQQCLVFDMTGFGLRNMDWSFIKFFSTIYEAYYPETLGMSLIHNAPWIFQGLWKAISPLLDPVVRDKVIFTNSKEDLCQLIDESHLPKTMGGTNDWEWTYTDPVDGEDSLFKDEAQRTQWREKRSAAQAAVVAATRGWVAADGADSVSSSRTKRDQALLEYRVLCIEGSPYLRPRNVHDRQGNLSADGTVVWMYNSAAGTETRGTPLGELKASLTQPEAAVSGDAAQD